MKKSLLLVLALAAAPACSKHNDVDVLHHEALVVAKFYAPKLDSLEQRVQAIFQRGATIPASTPGIEAVGARLTEARDMIIQLRQIVSNGPDGKSAVEKQADAAAKDRKVEDLEKLIHDTEATVDRGLTVINSDLDSVESWIAYFDRQALALPAPGAQPPPVPAPAPAPGSPEGAAPAGTPPAAPAENPSAGREAGPNGGAGSAAPAPAAAPVATPRTETRPAPAPAPGH